MRRPGLNGFLRQSIALATATKVIAVKRKKYVEMTLKQTKHS